MTKQEAARLVILSHIATLQSWFMQGPQGINSAANLLANLLGIENMTIEQIREKWAHLFDLTEEEKAKQTAQAVPASGRSPVMGFSSMEGFLDHLQKVKEEENEQPLAVWQQAMKPGDCFLQRSDYGGVPLDIYGVILEPEGEDADFFEKMPNHRLCRCYSKVCVEGEIGTVHISCFTEKMSTDLFNEVVEQFQNEKASNEGDVRNGPRETAPS
jgi:hypothetical protein